MEDIATAVVVIIGVATLTAGLVMLGILAIIDALLVRLRL